MDKQQSAALEVGDESKVIVRVYIAAETFNKCYTLIHVWVKSEYRS